MSVCGAVQVGARAAHAHTPLRCASCSYNHKARHAIHRLAISRRLTAGMHRAEEWLEVAQHLQEKLREIGSLVELALELFGDDAAAADAFVGVGAAPEGVEGPDEHAPVYAAVALREVYGLGLRVGCAAAADPRASLAPRDGAPASSRWRTGQSIYHVFGTPGAIAPVTATRLPVRLADGESPVLIQLEAYARLANDAAAVDKYVAAGDIAGHVVVVEGGSPKLRTRTMHEATKAAAVAASVHLANLEKRGGELPRLDATYQLKGGPGTSFVSQLASMLRDVAVLTHDSLVTTPLQPVLRHMGSMLTSLCAQHLAALSAMNDPHATQLESLAVHLHLRKTAACMRAVATGRWAGQGAPGPKLCLPLGLPQMGVLPPPPAAAGFRRLAGWWRRTLPQQARAAGVGALGKQLRRRAAARACCGREPAAGCDRRRGRVHSRALG